MEHLEVAWSGALETAGLTEFTLSSFGGEGLGVSRPHSSSLRYSPPWPEDQPQEDRAARIVNLLKQGLSYRAIAKECHCTISVPQRIAARYVLGRHRA